METLAKFPAGVDNTVTSLMLLFALASFQLGLCGPTEGKKMIDRDNCQLKYKGILIGARRIGPLIRQRSPVQPTPVEPTL